MMRKILTTDFAEKTRRPQRMALRYSLIIALLAAIACMVLVRDLRVLAKENAPRVQLHAENLGPRSIEDLTSKSIPRDYALAWQTMEQALEENRPGLLDGYFPGIVRQDLTQRVHLQFKSGLHARYQDGGHKLEAIFYSPAGETRHR